MFKCVLGNHNTKHGEKLVRVVTQKRSVTYREGVTGEETVKEVQSCTVHAPKESVQK